LQRSGGWAKNPRQWKRRFHIPNAIRNGVAKEEMIEAVTHLAFYAGWPSTMSALQLTKELLAE